MPPFELRPIVTQDIDELVALHQRAQTNDGITQQIQRDELLEEFDELNRETDTRVAIRDGRLLGYAYTYYLPSEIKEERCYVFGHTDPDSRRQGVGGTLLDWGIERGRHQLASSGRDLPRYLRVDTYDFIESAMALFTSRGFSEVRYFKEMIRPIDIELPPMPDLGSIAITPWPTTRQEEIREAKNSAFLDHWGSTPASAESWNNRINGYGIRLDLSSIAIDQETNTVVGHCLNARYPADDPLTGRQEGWIENLGTVSSHRGRGIAIALILASLEAFRSEGFSHACLGVDAASSTGADRLYRNAGFENHQTLITYQIEV